MRQTIISLLPGTESDARIRLLVRKLVFTCVYYNNGNSLPFFSIPSSRGKVDQVLRPAERGCVLSHSSTMANGVIDRAFVGDVHTPHLLKAGLLLSESAERRKNKGAFVIHVQNGVASRPSRRGRAKGRFSGGYCPIEG